MKSFIKLIFLTLAIFLTFTLDMQTENIQPYSYIQNCNPVSAEIVSNNLRASEIFANETEENQNFLGNTTDTVLISFNNHAFIKNISVSNGSFIHNLSTNSKKIQQIRAP